MRFLLILVIFGWVWEGIALVCGEALHPPTAEKPFLSFPTVGPPSVHSGQAVRGSDYHEGDYKGSNRGVRVGRHDGKPFAVGRIQNQALLEASVIRGTPWEADGEEGKGTPPPQPSTLDSPSSSLSHFRMRRDARSSHFKRFLDEDVDGLNDMYQLVSEDGGWFVSAKKPEWHKGRQVFHCSRVQGRSELLFLKVGFMDVDVNRFTYYNGTLLSLQSIDGVRTDLWREVYLFRTTGVPDRYQIFMVHLNRQPFRHPLFCNGTKRSHTVFQLVKVASPSRIKNVVLLSKDKVNVTSFPKRYTISRSNNSEADVELIVDDHLHDQFQVKVFGDEGRSVPIQIGGLFSWDHPDRFNPNRNVVFLDRNSSYARRYRFPASNLHFRPPPPSPQPFVFDAVITLATEHFYWFGATIYDKTDARRTVFGWIRYSRVVGFKYVMGEINRTEGALGQCADRAENMWNSTASSPTSTDLERAHENVNEGEKSLREEKGNEEGSQ